MFLLTSFHADENDQIRNVFTLFIFCNIVTPIVNELLPLAHLVNIYKRYRIKKLGKKCLTAQIHAN